MSTNDPEPKRSEDHEFPFMELFNAEDFENPGEPLEDLDPPDDADALRPDNHAFGTAVKPSRKTPAGERADE